MKRWILAGILVFSLTRVHAVRVEWPNRLWKSSATTSVDKNVILSSGPIIFHGIQIDSPTLNQAGDSFFALYDSSMDVFTGMESTKAYKSLNSDSAQTAVCSPCVWDVPISSHMMYNKQGNARITILWDWFTTPTDKNYPHYKD